MQDAYGHCEALVRSADKDRYLAGLFAPAPARRHLYALYAFAAEIARVPEAVREPAAGEIRLQWWRDALGGERIEAAGNPVAAALFDTVAQYALPSEPLICLIDAHGFDLYDDAMASLAELDAYAEATAGTVFVLGAAILAGAGARQAGAGEAAPIAVAAWPADHTSCTAFSPACPGRRCSGGTPRSCRPRPPHAAARSARYRVQPAAPTAPAGSAPTAAPA